MEDFQMNPKAAMCLSAMVMAWSALPAWSAEKAEKAPMGIYGFDMKTIDGKTVSLSKYKGDVLMIVNVASK